MMAEKNDKPTEETPSPTSQAPEVEAEIVSDDDAAISSADISDGFSGEDGAPSAPSSPKKIALSSRSIIICVGIIVSLGVGFALWRFLPGEARPVPAADVVNQQPTPNAVETSETPQNETPTLPEQEKPAPSVASKITNDTDIRATAKKAKSDAQPIEPFPGETFLPPLPSTDKIEAGNKEFQEAGKEASSQSGSVTSEENNSTIDPDREQIDIPTFELEDTGSLTPGDLQDEATGSEALTSAIVGEEENSISSAADAIISEEAWIVAQGPAPDQNFAKIDNDIEAIKENFRTEIANLKSSLAQANDRDAIQRAEITTLRNEFLAALEARDEKANTEIMALTARLDKIQNDEGIAAGRLAAATIALSAVQRAIDGGKPYARELNMLAGFTPNALELAVLRRYAETGAPTIMQLKEEFDVAARMALAVSGRDDAEGFIGKLSARARSLISLRPAKPTAGNSTPAILSRAEGQLKSGALRASIAELEKLDPSSRAAIGNWIEAMTARATLDDAVTALYTRLATAP